MNKINLAGTKGAVMELIHLLDPDIQLPFHHFCGNYELVCRYSQSICAIEMIIHDDEKITYKESMNYMGVNTNMLSAIQSYE